LIVKVNRVIERNEILQLLSNGVDIIGMSLKLSDDNTDSRALSIDEIQNIRREVTIPNLSINLNLSEYRKEDIIEISKRLKPNSLNLFIEATSIRDFENLTENHLSTIKTINETNVDVIAFGNGFGYDGPSSISDSLRIYEKLEYEEVNIDTLGSKSEQRIKNREEWKKLLNIEHVEQNTFGSTILESITESMKNRPFLVDDRNIETVAVDKLFEIGAKGVTISLSSMKEDEYSKNLPNANHIANTRAIKTILEITKRMKEYGS
jgi:hypothetical protein